MQRIIETRSGVFGLMQALLDMSRQMKPSLRQMLEEEWAAAQGSEAVIYNPQAFGGHHIAENMMTSISIVERKMTEAEDLGPTA